MNELKVYKIYSIFSCFWSKNLFYGFSLKKTQKQNKKTKENKNSKSFKCNKKRQKNGKVFPILTPYDEVSHKPLKTIEFFLCVYFLFCLETKFSMQNKQLNRKNLLKNFVFFLLFLLIYLFLWARHFLLFCLFIWVK